MKRGFSLVELMIVVAVLGILAAIVVPQVQDYSTQAREAVAKDSLALLRGAIELYTAKHDDVPPGYKDDDVTMLPRAIDFYRQLILENRYLSEMPENPFNNLDTVKIISNAATFPATSIGGFGWVYQPATKTIALDWRGADKKGISYFEY